MLDLYTWPTPNGHKVRIMLEELGVAYNVIPIDIWAGEQFSPDLLRISPNNKMPALVDHDGPDGAPISIFESRAILLYLAEKHRRLLPDHPRGRWEVMHAREHVPDERSSTRHGRHGEGAERSRLVLASALCRRSPDAIAHCHGIRKRVWLHRVHRSGPSSGSRVRSVLASTSIARPRRRLTRGRDRTRRDAR